MVSPIQHPIRAGAIPYATVLAAAWPRCVAVVIHGYWCTTEAPVAQPIPDGWSVLDGGRQDGPGQNAEVNLCLEVIEGGGRDMPNEPHKARPTDGDPLSAALDVLRDQLALKDKRIDTLLGMVAGTPESSLYAFAVRHGGHRFIDGSRFVVKVFVVNASTRSWEILSATAEGAAWGAARGARTSIAFDPPDTGHARPVLSARRVSPACVTVRLTGSHSKRHTTSHVVRLLSGALRLHVPYDGRTFDIPVHVEDGELLIEAASQPTEERSDV